MPKNLEPLLHNSNEILHTHSPTGALEIFTPLSGTERVLLAFAINA
jgi:hypothetical protein